MLQSSPTPPRWWKRPRRPAADTACRPLAGAGKLGAFAGTYILNSLLSRLGLGDCSLIVAAMAVAGALATIALLPEPKGRSLEEITEPMPASAVALGLAESRAIRSPSA